MFSCSSSQSSSEYFLPRVSDYPVESKSSVYQYAVEAGSGINAYVLDTGVFAGHTEFAGRLVEGPSFVSEEELDDLNGHGTCCCGILGGTLFGAAKNVTLIPIKVLSNIGSGINSDIISGIAWAVNDKRVSFILAIF